MKNCSQNEFLLEYYIHMSALEDTNYMERGSNILFTARSQLYACEYHFNFVLK